MTSIVYADQTLQYTYDTGANGSGRLTQLSDGAGTTGWSYDALGRVVGRTQTVDGIALTTAYRNSSAGEFTGQTTPSGQSIGFG